MSIFFYKQSAFLLKICICSGSVVECLTRDGGAQTGASPASLHCVLAQDTFILAKYRFQPRKTCSFMTERLLMRRKESNQTKNKQYILQKHVKMLYLLFDKLHIMFDL